MNLDDFRWGYTFLQTDTRLDEQSRYELVVHATEMYLQDESTRHVDGKNYGGTLKMNGYATLGTFAGLQFEAKVDTERGKANLSFLVSEQTGFLSSNRSSNVLN